MVDKRLDMYSQSMINNSLKGNGFLNSNYFSIPIAVPMFTPIALGVRSNLGNNTTEKYSDIPMDNNINTRKDDIPPHTEIDFEITVPRKNK